MITIVTKYYGPSNVKGSRIIAKTNNGQKIVHSYGDSSSDEEHIIAAKKLVKKMQDMYNKTITKDKSGSWWLNKEWIMGQLPDGSMVHVLVDDTHWTCIDEPGK